MNLKKYVFDFSPVDVHQNYTFRNIRICPISKIIQSYDINYQKDNEPRMHICRRVNFEGLQCYLYQAILQNKYNCAIQLNCYMQLNALDKPLLWFALNSSQIIKSTGGLKLAFSNSFDMFYHQNFACDLHFALAK